MDPKALLERLKVEKIAQGAILLSQYLLESGIFVTRKVFANKDGSQRILTPVSSDNKLNHAQLTTNYQRRLKVEE